MYFAAVSQSYAEPTVGAYYYPWWGGSGHSWNETLRDHLTPETQGPEIGHYDNTSDQVIAEHINQSHRGNISLWASSWWGPGSFSDTTFRNDILTHPRVSELEYAVHYESQGRFGSPSETPEYDVLISDFEYLAENVFSHPDYYRIDGRPVVFMYVTRAHFDNPDAQLALSAARQSLQSNYGYDPYVIGDEIFGSTFNVSRASHFDAVTTFDVYGMSGLKQNGATQAAIDAADQKYSDAASAGATVIPAVTPGYNDTAVRAGNNPVPRYFSDESISEAGSVFTAFIEEAAIPNVDSSVEELIMVNSFNEWHEDTQIEASVVTPATNTDDSQTGSDYTFGQSYEGYGSKYLDLLRMSTTESGIPLLDGDADFDGDLDADDVVAFVEAWKQEYLVDGVRVGGVESRENLPDFDYNGIVDFNDLYIMRDYHKNLDAALAVLFVPELSSISTAIVGLLTFLPWRRGGR